MLTTARLTCRPERRADFLKVIRGIEHGTLTNEPLNRAFVWGEVSAFTVP